MKNISKQPGTLKVYLVSGIALAVATSLFTISSCKKDGASVPGAIVASSTPPTHDKPYIYSSNANQRVGILVEDKDGNWVPLDRTRNKKGSQTLSSCSNDSYAMDLIYRGYTNDDACFNGPPGSSALRVSWDLYLPEDVNITNDATCVARIKIGPSGFSTAPTGTGFRTISYTYNYKETVDIDGMGTMMKKWRISTNATPFSEPDYCTNNTVTPTFKIKTDCPDIASIQPVLTTDYMDVNALSIPDLWPYNESAGTQHKIKFVPNVPICGPSCHGYWKWCTNYQLQYRISGASTWSPASPYTWYSNDIISFVMPVPSAGTYQFRYKGLIRGTTTSGVWSEWIQPSGTVNVL